MLPLTDALVHIWQFWFVNNMTSKIENQKFLNMVTGVQVYDILDLMENTAKHMFEKSVSHQSLPVCADSFYHLPPSNHFSPPPNHHSQALTVTCFLLSI